MFVQYNSTTKVLSVATSTKGLNLSVSSEFLSSTDQKKHFGCGQRGDTCSLVGGSGFGGWNCASHLYSIFGEESLQVPPPEKG